MLLLPCCVGVGAESETGVIVAEHTADGFDTHAILQCQRCEGMSEIMKADMLQSRVLEDFLMEVETIPAERKTALSSKIRWASTDCACPPAYLAHHLFLKNATTTAPGPRCVPITLPTVV